LKHKQTLWTARREALNRTGFVGGSYS
jgi:hypothetical protein